MGSQWESEQGVSQKKPEMSSVSVQVTRVSCLILLVTLLPESESRPAPWRSWAGLRDPDDPRNLFNFVYGINSYYGRRSARDLSRSQWARNVHQPEPTVPPQEPEVYSHVEDFQPAPYSPEFLEAAPTVRRGRRPDDPRNLFRAVHGYRR